MSTKPNTSQITYDSGSNKQDLNNILDTVVPITDYTALRNYTGRATQVRITADGIAGFFKYDSTDTTSIDNGGTIIVAATKRWKRVFDGSVNVKWFGADETGTADSRVAFQSAINSAQSGSDVLIGSGNYLLSASSSTTQCVLVDRDIRLVFDGVVIIKTSDSTRAVLKITASTNQNWTGLIIDGDFKANFGLEIVQSGVQISGVRAINFYPQITGLAAAAYYILNSSDVAFSKCFAGNVRSLPNAVIGDSQGVAAGFLFLGVAPIFGTNSVVDCVVDNVYNSESGAYEDEDGVNTQTINTVSVISGSTFKRCMKRGVKIITPGVVRDNLIISSRGVIGDSNGMFSGVSVYSSDVVVDGNRIQSSSTGGSFISGIDLQVVSGSLKNITVQDNHITFSENSNIDSVSSIYLVGDIACILQGNILRFPATGAFSKYGIRCFANTLSRVELQISSNRIFNAGYGIWAVGAYTGRISGNVITCDGSNVAILITRGAVDAATPYPANIIFDYNSATVTSATGAYCVRIFDTRVSGCVAIGNSINLGVSVGINGKHTEIASSNRAPVFYATSPSLAFSGDIQFSRGDTIINQDCRDASPVRAWTARYGNSVAAAASWSVNGFMMMKGATVSRPTLTPQDIGVQYLDTTLAANGKLITWNGFAWLDAMGGTV